MPDFSLARDQATRAKNDLFNEMQQAQGERYAQLSTDYVTAVTAEAQAYAREMAATVNPHAGTAEQTLTEAARALQAKLDAIAAQQAKIESLTGVLNALLGAIMLFGL